MSPEQKGPSETETLPCPGDVALSSAPRGNLGLAWHGSALQLTRPPGWAVVALLCVQQTGCCRVDSEAACAAGVGAGGEVSVLRTSLPWTHGRTPG